MHMNNNIGRKTLQLSREFQSVFKWKRQYDLDSKRFATTGSYNHLIAEKRGEKRNVGFVKLHRPRQHNAISSELSAEIYRVFDEFDKDDQVRAIVYTGGESIFTVGADITQMKGYDFHYMLSHDFSILWNKIHDCRKVDHVLSLPTFAHAALVTFQPIIAAVNGFCVGGGSETVMMCDIIYASERAKFGQPEIKIGIIPGAGGTQRLPRAMGKSKAMEAILSGNITSAHEAERSGLISRVLPSEQVIPEAIKLAEIIASKPRIATLMAKEAVKFAHENSLKEGLKFEGLLSKSLPATNDFKEGMRAFIEKRSANFSD